MFKTPSFNVDVYSFIQISMPRRHILLRTDYNVTLRKYDCDIICNRILLHFGVRRRRGGKIFYRHIYTQRWALTSEQVKVKLKSQFFLTF